MAYALAAHCDAIAGPADAERRLAESAEVFGLARARGDHHVELLGRRLHLLALLETGDLAAAEAEAVAYARTAALLRQPVYNWCVPLWRGMRALTRGRFAECAECVAEARRIGAQAGSRNADINAGDQEFFLLLTTGRAADALALLESVFAEIAEYGTQIQVTLAYGLARAGHLEEAAGHLDVLAQGALAELPLDSEWLAVLAQVAETVQAIGGHPVARWAYQQLLAHRARFVVEGIGAVFRGSVEHYLGLLASDIDEPGKAAEHAARAEAAHRRIGLSRAVEPEVSATTGNMFRREGDVWMLGYAGRVVRLRHAKGLNDLAQLLAQPGREVPALDLAVPIGMVAGDISEPGLHTPGDLGEVLDGQARAAYKRRLAELEDELADADQVWAERVRAERDALVDQLAGAYGLAGRPRRAGDPAERARTAVTARLRAALNRIEAAHPELGRHLRRSVRTGTLCVYAPDEATPWQL